MTEQYCTIAVVISGMVLGELRWSDELVVAGTSIIVGPYHEKQTFNFVRVVAASTDAMKCWSMLLEVVAVIVACCLCAFKRGAVTTS